MPLDMALRYGSGIAKALAEVHALGVVMADLKPQNVLISDQVGVGVGARMHACVRVGGGGV